MSINETDLIAAIQVAFRPLVDAHGFEEIISPDGFHFLVRYRRLNVFVELAHHAPEYHVELSVGQLDADYSSKIASAFGAYDLVRSGCGGDFYFKAHHPNDSAGCMLEYARLILTCGTRLLNGDVGIFDDMREAQANYADHAK